MLREVAALGAAVAVLNAVSPAAWAGIATASQLNNIGEARVQATPLTDPRQVSLPHASVVATGSAAIHHRAAKQVAEAAHSPATAHPPAATRLAEVHHARPARAAIEPETPSEPLPEPPVLTDQEQEVSQLAGENGDREFLMVDKSQGRIILFQGDKPIYAGPALTGASTADRLPPYVLKEKFSKLTAPDTKVTPAGRFTVSRSHDSDYGTVLDINEIHGRDWGLAIHKVYLGTPSEHRGERLRSPDEEDKHITYGCINVTPDAIRFLLHELPAKQRVPLYILPEDAAKTTAYFAPHTS